MPACWCFRPIWPARLETDDTPETEGSDVSVTRYGGADRYETSLLIAEAVAAEAGGSLESVVLVSGERWADAVVAAPLAGSLDAPVLMTPTDELRADTAEFLEQTGVTDVWLVGSAPEDGGRFAQGVIFQLLDIFPGVFVVSGADHYETGAMAARNIDLPGDMSGFGRTAIIASGEVFADALVAGPFAARGHHPVMLTPSDELHAEVATNLSLLEIEHVVLMGGTAALSEAVEQSVKDLDIAVTRLAGATRYDTAVKAAELVNGRYSATADQECFTTSTIGVARARVPFDSFSAAPLLSRLCAPLVLADPAQIPADTAAYLDAAREANPTVDLRVFGGDAAVSQTGIDTYLTGQDPAEVGDGDEADDEADDDESDDEGDDDAASGTEPVVLPAGTCGDSIDDEPTQFVPSTNAEDPAWSPDGTRLAFVRPGSEEEQVITSDADGLNEAVVFAFPGHLRTPRWSPDGQRLAFHTIGGDSSHVVYVGGARGDPVPGSSGCRPEDFPGLIPGHHLHGGPTPLRGTRRIAVLFVDFADKTAIHTTREEDSGALEYAETYLEANSYGALDIEFVPVHRWLRADQTAEENLEYHIDHLLEADGEVTSHAAQQAGAEIDFSTIDEIMVVFPSSHFSGGNTVASVEIDGVSLPVSWVNTFPRPHPGEPRLWGGRAAHEMAHNLGLLDIYGYGYEPTPDPPPGKIWVSSEWGLMFVNVFFLVPADHPGITATFERPDGTTATEQYPWLAPREMLGWHRWVLGWLDESQIECVTDDQETVELSALADPGSGTAMAAIRLGRNEVLVLESRREQGYDTDLPATRFDGASGTQPRLIEEGVLAYTVDAYPASHRLPVRLAQDPDGTQMLDEDPILAVGESVTVRGYTITVTADDGDTHTVSITRDE